MRSVCRQGEDDPPGAQTKRRGGVRPGRDLLGGETSPAAVFRTGDDFVTGVYGAGIILLSKDSTSAQNCRHSLRSSSANWANVAGSRRLASS